MGEGVAARTNDDASFATLEAQAVKYVLDFPGLRNESLLPNVEQLLHLGIRRSGTTAAYLRRTHIPTKSGPSLRCPEGNHSCMYSVHLSCNKTSTDAVRQCWGYSQDECDGSSGTARTGGVGRIPFSTSRLLSTMLHSIFAAMTLGKARRMSKRTEVAC